MDSKAHRHIVEKALEWLPEQSKAFWEENTPLMVDASQYPDIFAAPKHVDEEKAKIEPQWRDLVHVDIDDEDSHLHTTFKPDDIRGSYSQPLSRCLERINEALKNDKKNYAAKLAGCFSHVIGDTGQPAHVVGDGIAQDFLPFQSDDKFMVYHSAVESIIGQANEVHIPQLLGTTWAEIEWRMVERFTLLRRLSRSQYFPILHAIYQNDMAQAQIGADKTVQACAELFSDLLHTLYHMHVEKFEADDLANLAELSLSDLIPADCYCDMMFCYAPMIDRHPNFSKREGIYYPLVDFDLGTGSPIGGIALFPNMAPGFSDVREAYVEYCIPPNCFSTFEGIPGLNHNCDNGTNAIFEIWLDGEQVYQSQTIDDKTPGESIRIELGDASRIRLIVKDARPAPCPTEFFYPIWGKPVLSK